MEEKIAAILAEFPINGATKRQRTAQLLPLLQCIQRTLGYLPQEAIPQIAKHLRIPPSHIMGVATFYSQFRFTPAARNSITVCCGTACHVRGSAKLLDELGRTLGLAAGETAKNLSFSLDTIACFGSCALAPVVVVNSKVNGRMNRTKLLKQINALTAADAAQSEEGQA